MRFLEPTASSSVKKEELPLIRRDTLTEYEPLTKHQRPSSELQDDDSDDDLDDDASSSSSDDEARMEWHMEGFLQCLIVLVVGLNSAYWTCFFPIEYAVADWIGQSRLYGSVMVGVLFAPFPLASALFQRIMRTSHLAEGDARESYALWMLLVILGTGGFTTCLFFPNAPFTPGLLILFQCIGGASQAVIYVCRQVIVLTTSPRTRVFYYALYTGSNDFGAGAGILLTGVLSNFARSGTVINGTPLYLVLPTFAILCLTIIIGGAILVFHPRHPSVVPEPYRQLRKPPPSGIASNQNDNRRKRLCILACYVVGFNRVIIKTMWFSIALDVWQHIFHYSRFQATIAVFAVTSTGVLFQQTFAYLSHLLDDRTWMQLTEIGLFLSLGLCLVVDMFPLIVADKTSLLRDMIYFLSSFGLYLSCQINANTSNVFATKYAIPTDHHFDQPAIGFWQTILQNCLAKLLAPILATTLWNAGGFQAYALFSIALSASTILFSNTFILGGSSSSKASSPPHKDSGLLAPPRRTTWFTHACANLCCSDCL